MTHYKNCRFCSFGGFLIIEFILWWFGDKALSLRYMLYPPCLYSNNIILSSEILTWATRFPSYLFRNIHWTQHLGFWCVELLTQGFSMVYRAPGCQFQHRSSHLGISHLAETARNPFADSWTAFTERHVRCRGWAMKNGNTIGRTSQKSWFLGFSQNQNHQKAPKLRGAGYSTVFDLIYQYLYSESFI